MTRLSKAAGSPVYSKAGMMMFPAGQCDLPPRDLRQLPGGGRAIMQLVYEGAWAAAESMRTAGGGNRRYVAQVLRKAGRAADPQKPVLSMQE